MSLIILAVGALLSALQAFRARRLLIAALWLAAVSGFTAILLYLTGAQQAAVIELSVGAGLVFILFVFAITLSGESLPPRAEVVPSFVALVLLGLMLLGLGILAWPKPSGLAETNQAPLSVSLWANRPLDSWLQMALLFTGAITIAGLLAQAEPASHPRPLPPPEPARRVPSSPTPIPTAFRPGGDKIKP